MCNSVDTVSQHRNEWIALVVNEQRHILASHKKNPVEILMEVFELFDENFDTTIIKEIELFDCLTTLYEANANKELAFSLEEHFPTLLKLTKIFRCHREIIREFSVELFYALLNFIDFLKLKGIYYKFPDFSSEIFFD